MKLATHASARKVIKNFRFSGWAGARASDLPPSHFNYTLQSAYSPWSMSNELEESQKLMLDFAKLQSVAKAGEPVVPVVVQDFDSRDVLIVAYANAEALRLSLEEKRAVFWSTSRGEIWRKGATSGDTLTLVEAFVNCEQNSLLFLVKPTQHGVCHTRDANGNTRPSCYYRRIKNFVELEFI